MYSPTPKSAYDIINNRNLKLPRFQRKQAWKDEDRFKLCISLFKGYPLGTIVERQDDNKTSWLLDGRQRRDTLTQMLDPVNVYNWAKSFIKFSVKDDPSQIKDAFYNALYEFLYTDDELDENDEESEEDEQTNGAVEEDMPEETNNSSVSVIPSGIEYDDENELEDLLYIICSVHKTTKSSSQFTKPFDFKGEDYRPKYYDTDKCTVNSTKLSQWILGQNIPDADTMTSEEVIGMFDGCPPELKKVIGNRIKEIKSSVKPTMSTKV